MTQVARTVPHPGMENISQLWALGSMTCREMSS